MPGLPRRGEAGAEPLLVHAFGGAFCSALEPARPFSVLSFPDELTRHSFLHRESARAAGSPPTPAPRPPGSTPALTSHPASS